MRSLSELNASYFPGDSIENVQGEEEWERALILLKAAERDFKQLEELSGAPPFNPANRRLFYELSRSLAARTKRARESVERYLVTPEHAEAAWNRLGV